MEKQKSISYWESYYKTHKNPSKPSFFAEFVSPFLSDDKILVELGCGNGRDSFFLAESSNVEVIAVDQCTQEIEYLNLQRKNKSNIKFLSSDFTNLSLDKNVDYVYSRFTLHAVTLKGEMNTFEWVSKSLNKGGLFFIEVRSIYDDLYGQGTKIGHNEFMTDHYRRFIKMEEMIENAKSFDLRLLYGLQSKGLAPYVSEDPEVIRLIFQQSF